MSDNLVLIIGGSRSTGLHAAHILQRMRIPVRVLARDPVSALKRLGSGFDIMRGDLTDRASLLSALEGVGQLILTAGVRSGRFARQSVAGRRSTTAFSTRLTLLVPTALLAAWFI